METYTTEDLMRLGKIAGIPEDRLIDLGNELEDAAAMYRRNASIQENVVTNRQAQRELQSIATTAAKLARQLEEMSDLAWRAFRHKVEQDIAIGRVSETEDPSFFVSLKHLGTDAIGLSFDEQSLAKLIRAAEIAARIDLDKFSQKKSGPSQNYALDAWILSAARIWKDFTSREFTRWVTNDGQPISQASQFCTEAFKPVSPETQSTRVHNAMKKYIKEDRA